MSDEKMTNDQYLRMECLRMAADRTERGEEGGKAVVAHAKELHKFLTEGSEKQDA